MKKKRWFVLLMTLALLIGLTACGKSEAKDQSNLSQALAMLPANTTRVYFTDWALLKAYEGFPDLSSKSSMDERMIFLRFGGSANPPSPMRQATASGFGLSRFLQHAENWGWDSTDLVWEVTVELEGPPTFVLQFPDDFDFAPLVALFEERGFDQAEYQGVTIFSHEMDLGAEWLRTTEFGILNTAVLEEEKRLVLSAGIEAVQAILTVYGGDIGSLADHQAARATINRLGEVASAFISVGGDTCQSFSADPMLEMLGKEISDEQMARLKELLEQESQVHLYSALGVGYRYEEDQAVGLVVMHYNNADDARADLEARRQLAQEGISLRMKQPYSKVLFTVDQASVEGDDLVLRVSPINSTPRRLFDMVFARDMLFAGCP